MKFRFLAILAASMGVALTASGATTQKASFDEFRQGDLIFQETSGPQSIAVKAATASPYTHVGMIRIVNGKPVVIEAARTVSETPLDEFIARGAGQRYAVYRMDGLSDARARKVIAAARKDLGKPYDLYFRLDDAAIYCSELPWRAFKAVGMSLGKVEKVTDLNISVASAAALIDSRWKKHPDCKRGTKEQCMAKLERQDIVTPVSLSQDRKLSLIYSNF